MKTVLGLGLLSPRGQGPQRGHRRVLGSGSEVTCTASPQLSSSFISPILLISLGLSSVLHSSLVRAPLWRRGDRKRAVGDSSLQDPGPRPDR
jgi:hypothetical protein